MTKAEQRAFAYAKTHSHRDYDQTFDAVKYGYLQAEKDHALTWEDMVTINTLGSEVIGEHLFDNWSERQLYEEVLRRFREMKNK